MLQIFQNLRNGETSLMESPDPVCDANSIVISSTVSLISAGTERMLVDFSKSNYVEKALQQPEKVKQVLAKIKTDGLMTTIDAVQSKLDSPLAMGYNSVGVISSVGSNVSGFKVGDRVVSNGPHGTKNKMGPNMVARIPDNVSDETAVFTVMGSIGLQGVRLANPQIGETFVVTGVGLIGLLTVQILRANGCRVLALDYDERKLALAKNFGAETCNLSKGEDPIQFAEVMTQGRGVDGVLITAATDSSEPVSVAARMCRKLGRIVLVGVSGLELDRSEFYEKELTFQVSCSYGPGRYDASYEQNGVDYPFGLVRWPLKRNFEAILDLMSSGALKTEALVSYRYELQDYKAVFEKLSLDKSAIGLLIQYSKEKLAGPLTKIELREAKPLVGTQPSFIFVGVGNYVSRVLLPAFGRAQARLGSLVVRSGGGATQVAKKFGFQNVTSDFDSELKDSKNNSVVIGTRHNSHASMVKRALFAGKNVFVEKPLALTLDEVADVEQALQQSTEKFGPLALMVGFNRRFSPQAQKMKELIATCPDSKSIIYTFNAGALPKNHWARDLEVGGGRIVGEACHAIDLVRYLIGRPIQSMKVVSSPAEQSFNQDPNVILTLQFVDGSVASIHYLTSGANSFSKEKVEIFCGGKVLCLDNYLRLTGYGWSGFKKMNLWSQDKGQNNCVNTFIQRLQNGGPNLIPYEEVFEVARYSILAQQAVNKTVLKDSVLAKDLH